MKHLPLIAHAAITLFSVVTVAALTYTFIAHGDGPFPSWQRDFGFLGIYFETHVYAIAMLLGLTAAALCGKRALSLLGMAQDTPGLRASSNLLAALIAATLIIVVLRFQLWTEFLPSSAGGAPAVQLTEEALDFPELPLAPEGEEPPWILTALDRTTADFESFAGKAVFLNFWATWCGPCIAEMPNIQALYDAVKDREGVEVVLVSNEEPETVKAWVEAEGYTMPIYTVESLAKRFHLRGFPTTYILTPEGRIAFEHIGYAAWDGGKTQDFLERLASS